MEKRIGIVGSQSSIDALNKALEQEAQDRGLTIVSASDFISMAEDDISTTCMSDAEIEQFKVPEVPERLFTRIHEGFTKYPETRKERRKRLRKK